MLYTGIFLLLQAEDNALLIGAIASFLVLATTMYLTRKIDWYSPLAAPAPVEQPVTPAGPGQPV